MFQLKLVRSSPQSVEFTETFDVSHSLYQKYQAKIHNDSPSKCSKEQFKRFLVHSPLKVCGSEIVQELCTSTNN